MCVIFSRCMCLLITPVGERRAAPGLSDLGAAVRAPAGSDSASERDPCREPEPMKACGQLSGKERTWAGPCTTGSREQRGKPNGDTYAVFNSFCSVGSFLFCIIMSQNVNNCHKVHLLPRWICKGWERWLWDRWWQHLEECELLTEEEARDSVGRGSKGSENTGNRGFSKVLHIPVKQLNFLSPILSQFEK